MQIPGLSDLITRETEIPDSLLLLCGPAGAGKSMYSKQFFVDCLMNGYYCIYISSSLTDRQYRSLFADIEESKLLQRSHFLNPYLQKTLTGHPSSSSSSSLSTSVSENKLSLTLEIIHELIKKERNGEEEAAANDYEKRQNKVIEDSLDNTKKVCLVVDSLTHLLAIFNEDDVLQFVNALSFLLKEVEATAIFVLTTTSLPSSSPSSSPTTSATTITNDNFSNRLGSIFDGILEMKFDEDKSGSLNRNIRLLSIRGIHHTPAWISFKIDHNGRITFGSDQLSELTCVLCKAPILDTPVFYSELTFHSHHVDLYKKLLGVYGSNIAEFGLSEGVINANFFFIDIVGLSDPSLSVRKQMEKIERLNNLINSCDAFKKVAEKKIILPTGDGMAIGFMLNPELPLQLSMQLHKELYKYNHSKKISEEDIIGVRIGLATGPVFIVSDINSNQNIWGPGIILARRVMDLGDSGHILIADILAEQLIALKDEYRVIIKPVGNYQIKHGQTIKMYSAYSQEFGNSDIPAKSSKSNLSVESRNG
jgi:KaiC/GvpD/RAD55 family RecA-like ATPase/class 3 adenylate cyclase